MTRRDRVALTVVAVAVALAAYWFLLFAPKREEAARLQGQVAQQRQRLQTAEANLAASQAARSSYAANYTAVARLGKAVPADDDVPSLVYQLDSSANASTVDFQSIKLEGGSPGSTPAPAAPIPPPSGSSSGASTASTPTSATPGAPAAPTQAATAALPPGAVVGPAGLATMPFTFAFNGSFRQLSDFFGRVQRYIDADARRVTATGRLLTLNSISLTFSGRGYPHLKANVSATAYLLPASEGLLNGASPTAPPQGAAQPASSPGSASPTTPATVAP